MYGKGSLIRKMPGDRWQKFANLRAYLGFMWTYPGKKLLFMGGEFAQDREWNHDTGLDWDLLDEPEHRGMQTLVRDLNGALPLRAGPAHRDCDPAGFRWVVVDDADNSVFAYLRQDLGAIRPGAGRVQLHAGAAARISRRRAARGVVVGAAEHGCGGLWRVQCGQLWRDRGGPGASAWVPG